MQRVTLDHTSQALHRDTIIGADIHTAAAEDTDRRIYHDIELTLKAAPCLSDCLLRAVAGLGLRRDAKALLQRQRWNDLIGYGLIVVYHTAAEVGQLNLDCLFSGSVLAG